MSDEGFFNSNGDWSPFLVHMDLPDDVTDRIKEKRKPIVKRKRKSKSKRKRKKQKTSQPPPPPLDWSLYPGGRDAMCALDIDILEAITDKKLLPLKKHAIRAYKNKMSARKSRQRTKTFIEKYIDRIELLEKRVTELENKMDM